ncbi:MAG TPA: helix-turn-helix transcriptional regulator [Clostridia bacterium]|nr:helix-turn-helix transcriptional regulator [Clostridia bacterium]
MKISKRQKKIIDIVKSEGPISGKEIATKLNLAHSTLRTDLAVLTKAGVLEARPRVGYFYVEKSADIEISEQILKVKVGQVKSLAVVVSEETSVYDAVVTMFLEDVGTLFVVQSGGILAGVLSRKDLLKATLGNSEINKTPVSVVMTRMPNIVVCTLEESVYDAARKMIEHQVDALPVVKPLDNSGRLEVVGRISKTNITKLFVELGRGGISSFN